MADPFEQLAAQIKTLSDKELQALQELVELEQEEREWDELTSRPGAQAFHDKLREELRIAEERGEIEDLDLGEDDEP